MTCKFCASAGVARVVRQFPAGDSRSSARADAAAAEERRRTGSEVHVHYAADSDQLVVAETGGGR